MPSVTLRTTGPDCQEETLTEYLCDWPDCPNAAEHFLGGIPELRVVAAVCRDHAALIASRRTL
jgi:hypothetical protein